MTCPPFLTHILPPHQAPKEGTMMSHDAADSPESKFIGGTIQEVPDKVARANPITYVSAGEKPPPFFLAHGKSTFSPLPSHVLYVV